MKRNDMLKDIEHAKMCWQVLPVAIVLLILCMAENAYAYIGPGAGFALVTSFFVIFVSLLIAIVSLLIWPFRQLKWTLTRKKCDRK